MTAVRLDDGDVDALDDALSPPEPALVTCPRREGDCPYSFGPDSGSDLPPGGWLSMPYCPSCGVSLVAVRPSDYRGPAHATRPLGGGPA